MRKDLDLHKEEIIIQLKAGVPRIELCRKFKCKYETLKKRIETWGFSTLKNQSRKGIAHEESYKPSSVYTVENGPNITSTKLRLKLLKDKVKEHKCESCNYTEWLGKLIPLELDHINGNHYDNRLENLRLLCPNCHAQTETNSGKNRGKYGGVDQLAESTVLDAV